MKKSSVVKSTTTSAAKQVLKGKLKIGRPITNAKAVSASTSAAGKGKPAAGQAPSTNAEPRSGINTGKTSGMRVMAYQDFTLARNDKPEFRLTDEELAADWRREFPESRAVKAGRITEVIVRGVRNLFNQGTGGHGTPGQTQSSQPWVIVNGKRVQSAYTRARKPEAETAEATPAKAASKSVAKKPVVVAHRKAKSKAA